MTASNRSRKDDCVETLHMHVGICQRQGYANGRADAEAEAAERVADRDKGLADYLASMERAGGGLYTTVFRAGFRHALEMLAAYESDGARS